MQRRVEAGISSFIIGTDKISVLDQPEKVKPQLRGVCYRGGIVNVNYPGMTDTDRKEAIEKSNMGKGNVRDVVDYVFREDSDTQLQDEEPRRGHWTDKYEDWS